MHHGQRRRRERVPVLTNPALLASGIGMMAVGVLPVAYWRTTRKVGLTPFLFGCVMWFAAVAPKVVLDLTVGGMIDSWASSAFGALGAFVLISLYVGVRTGTFESGFTYVAFLKTRLKNVGYDDAIAFGLAFGGTEAVILGLSSFLNVLVFLLRPSLIDQLPLMQRDAILAALNAPSIIVFAPMIERGSTILVHLFATTLVYAAAVRRSTLFFWGSFLYRTMIDAMVPGFSRLLAVSPNSVMTTYMIELVIAIYGLLGLLGVIRLRGRTAEPD